MTPLRALTLSLFALAVAAAPALDAKPAAKGKTATKAPWTAVTASTADGGVRMGNPAAPVKLVEYASYTCPHCAHFQEEGIAPVEKHVTAGKVSLEVRPYLRDPIDVTAYLLARCGGLSRFFGNHKLLFSTQEEWLGRARAMSPTTRNAWTTGPIADRPGRIAADLGLDTLMLKRGLTAPQIKACLANTAMQEGGAKITKYAADTIKIQGTPSFLINGKLVDDAYSWQALEPALNAAIR